MLNYSELVQNSYTYLYKHIFNYFNKLSHTPNNSHCRIPGLKKVSDDMKTHKNPTLRTGPKPFIATKPSPSPSPVAAKKTVAPAAKPPKCALEGKKWLIVG